MLQIGDPYLFETPHGAVLQCACCGRIQVEFRGEALLIYASYFEVLSWEVAEAAAEVEAGRASGWWHLSSATDAGPVSLMLSADAMLALHELLEGTQAMMELERMLDDLLKL